MELEFPYYWNDKKYHELSELWKANDDVSIDYPLWSSSYDIESISLKLLEKIPDEFSFVILEYIAELNNTPSNILEEILLSGDAACKVAVCLRSNLSDELRLICDQSDDPNIISHIKAVQ